MHTVGLLPTLIGHFNLNGKSRNEHLTYSSLHFFCQTSHKRKCVNWWTNFIRISCSHKKFFILCQTILFMCACLICDVCFTTPFSQHTHSHNTTHQWVEAYFCTAVRRLPLHSSICQQSHAFQCWLFFPHYLKKFGSFLSLLQLMLCTRTLFLLSAGTSRSVITWWRWISGSYQNHLLWRAFAFTF